jgi:hypothetical protein
MKSRFLSFAVAAIAAMAFAMPVAAQQGPIPQPSQQVDKAKDKDKIKVIEAPIEAVYQPGELGCNTEQSKVFRVKKDVTEADLAAGLVDFSGMAVGDSVVFGADDSRWSAAKADTEKAKAEKAKLPAEDLAEMCKKPMNRDVQATGAKRAYGAMNRVPAQTTSYLNIVSDIPAVNGQVIWTDVGAPDWPYYYKGVKGQAHNPAPLNSTPLGGTAITSWAIKTQLKTSDGLLQVNARMGAFQVTPALNYVGYQVDNVNNGLWTAVPYGNYYTSNQTSVTYMIAQWADNSAWQVCYYAYGTLYGCTSIGNSDKFYSYRAQTEMQNADSPLTVSATRRYYEDAWQMWETANLRYDRFQWLYWGSTNVEVIESCSHPYANPYRGAFKVNTVISDGHGRQGSNMTFYYDAIPPLCGS